MPPSRVVIWIAIGVLVGWDCLAAALGWSTISAQIRVVDSESSGLVRWLLLGLWLHFFVMASWPK